MILLGITQELQVQKETGFGLYLSPVSSAKAEPDSNADNILDTDSVLLPKAQVPEGTARGDVLRVFVYKDSEDRPIATTMIPALELGQVARLTVKAITPIGSFLDWGLVKDLLLPYREQTHALKEGDTVLIGTYIDKSQRLCATMHIYPFLSSDSPYQKGEWVDGLVYEVLPNFGAYVVIDDKYSAMIPNKELHRTILAGTTVHARVAIVRPDGRLELSLQAVVPVQMDQDGAGILEKLIAADGFLPYHDKSDPEQIKQVFGLSKNAFKRAIGHLMKEGHIVIEETGIRKATH